jgi:hypothetical protein
MAAGRGLLAAEHALLVHPIMIDAAFAADWLLPPGSRSALNQPASAAHSTDRHLDGSPQPGETQDMIPVVLRTLESNHCSTTHDSNAPSTARLCPRSQHPDLVKQGQEPIRPAPGAAIQTAPATYETRPTGPGLTCGFAGGR